MYSRQHKTAAENFLLLPIPARNEKKSSFPQPCPCSKKCQRWRIAADSLSAREGSFKEENCCSILCVHQRSLQLSRGTGRSISKGERTQPPLTAAAAADLYFKVMIPFDWDSGREKKTSEQERKEKQKSGCGRRMSCLHPFHCGKGWGVRAEELRE